MKRMVGVIGLIATGALSPVAAGGQGIPVEGRSPAQASACNSLADSSMVKDLQSRADVIARLGVPDAIRVTPYARSANATQIDTIVHLEYDRGVVVDLRNVGDGQEWVSGAFVHVDSLFRNPGIRVGMTEAELMQVLGTGEVVADSIRMFNCGTGVGPDEPFFAHLSGGVLRSLFFSRYEG